MTNSVAHTDERTALGYGDYLRFSKLVYEGYGLYFSDNRREDLERGIRQAFAASTCTSLDQYFDLLQSAKDGGFHLERLVNAITIGETHFFRNTAQFDALYTHILPQIIKSRQNIRTLRFWSAGCASGEEPYSLAILLRELLPDIDDWSITILATDVNTEVLDRARKGVYGHWAFREERAKQRRAHYFRKLDHRYELDPEVRKMVTFKRLNLAGDDYPSYETNTMFMDLILCRNVVIYFSQEVTQGLVHRFYNSLINGGWLLVGHSEHSLITFQRFQTHNFPDAIAYQRATLATPFSSEGKPFPSEGKPFAQERKPISHEVKTVPRSAWSVLPPENLPIHQPILSNPVPESKSGESDLISLAYEHIEKGQLEQARKVLLEAIQQKPQHALSYTLLGRVYADLGYWEQSELWCRQAIGLDKLQMEAYYTLALVLQHRGQLDQAIVMLKKVIYLDRYYALGHFTLANLYHSHGQLPQALKSLDNARHLLESQAPEGLLPGSGGVTVGRIRETITHLGQQWQQEADRF